MGFHWNNLLCFEEDVNWDDIQAGEGASVILQMNNKKDYVRKCEKIIWFKISLNYYFSYLSNGF